MNCTALLFAFAGIACASPPHVRWDDMIEVASGGGHRGPWRMNESDYDYVDDPTVAIDAGGTAVVAWADHRRKDVLLQVYTPDGARRIETPVNVSRSPRVFSWLPRVAIAGVDATEINVLWQEIVFSGGTHGGEIFFARSRDGGRSFGRPINLSNTTAGDGKGRRSRDRWDNGSLDLAICPEGHLYAAWTEYEGALWFSRSVDGGASFARPEHIAGGGRAAPARGPSLAVGRDGAVHLAWSVGEDPRADIHLASSTDHGRTFGEPVAVIDAAGHADAPKIVVDRDGVIHLVYAERGAAGRYAIRYTRSAPEPLRFAPPRAISSPGPEGLADAHAQFPSISVDGARRVHVLWDLVREGDTRPAGLAFAISSDGGRSFSAPSVVPGTDAPALGIHGSQQGLFMRKLAVTAGGAIAVVTSTLLANQSSHIWLVRGTAGRDR